MEKVKDLLFDLGLNRLETDVYLFLLTNSPTTAYGIGKGISKPTANIYKAIDSLSSKGAVVVEDNKSKICKAVAPDEFIAQYQKNLLSKTEAAKELLSNLKPQPSDERSYTIDSVSLVFERFEQMMARCKTIAVVDAFPLALQRVVGAIEDASRRGVSVFVEAYSKIEIEGADVALVPVGDKALDHWQSQQLNLVIDGEEHLISLMDNDLKKVKHAIWSNNTYMSCMLHAGFMREQTLMKIMQAENKPNFERKVRAILRKQKFFYNSEIPGFSKLNRL
ncbi:MAG TPA: helix-turn-helix domain-containing protein [Tenuifilaceae bacterium]|nr:helix-turn-helix domain-containing protein [Tenuifilaceae bacterium]HPJ46130.1 helix-turn-helix domain-containing protein [Tenuifilaceae bacterium]HPQ34545.1 helix-turn-helix domain-containing protein [Tenuifilaceae bacterium]